MERFVNPPLSPKIRKQYNQIYIQIPICLASHHNIYNNKQKKFCKAKELIARITQTSLTS